VFREDGYEGFLRKLVRPLSGYHQNGSGKVRIMKKALLMNLVLFVSFLSAHAEPQFYDIHLKDGTVIRNVRYEIEEFFGQVFVTYTNQNGYKNRVDRSVVSHAVPLNPLSEARYQFSYSGSNPDFNNNRQGDVHLESTGSIASFKSNLAGSKMTASGIRGELDLGPTFPQRLIIFFDGVIWDNQTDREKICSDLYQKWNDACKDAGYTGAVLTIRDFQSQKDLAIQIPRTSPVQWIFYNARQEMNR
jgi:hypothetical protein